MGKGLQRRRQRRRSVERLQQLDKARERVAIVHYSCESFTDEAADASHCITSIAVRNFGSDQTVSFSLHHEAEVKRVDLRQDRTKILEFERKMLTRFRDYMKQHAGQFDWWVHWNMRDVKFGFAHLEHRLRALTAQESALDVPSGRRVNLAQLLVECYGEHYAAHPRMQDVINFNVLNREGFLVGQDEVMAFRDGRFLALHNSTLRKVAVFDEILEKMLDGTLRTRAKWHEVYGVHPEALVALVMSHWVFGVLTILAAIGGVISLVVWLARGSS